MTKDEAIAVLLSQKKYYNDKNEDSYVGFDDDDNEALDMAIEALEQEWIPVSKKTPPIAQRVYVSTTNGEVFIARYHSFDKWTFEPTGISYVYNKNSVVAWKPLPEPYKAESEVQDADSD